MSQDNVIPFEGMLNCWQGTFDVPDLLLAISRSGKTGHLVFVNPEGKKNLFVKEGRFIFAESSSQDYQLREFLLKQGTISAWDYNKLGKSVRPGKRFGALLVEAGLLKVEDLVPAVVGQVRGIVLGLFNRTETAYAFKEQKLSRHESITLKMPVDQLVIDGILTISSWRRISRGVGDLEQRYEIDHAFDDRIAKVEMDERGQELLALLETPHNIAELSRLSSLNDFQVGQFLWGFRALQWTTLSEPEATAQTAVSSTIDTVEDEDLVAAVATSESSAPEQSEVESEVEEPEPVAAFDTEATLAVDDDDVAAAAAAARELAAMETEDDDPIAPDIAESPNVDDPIEDPDLAAAAAQEVPEAVKSTSGPEPADEQHDEGASDDEDSIAQEIAAAAAALEAATAMDLDEADEEPRGATGEVAESTNAGVGANDALEQESEAPVTAAAKKADGDEKPPAKKKKKVSSGKSKKKTKKKPAKKSLPDAPAAQAGKDKPKPNEDDVDDGDKKDKRTWVERIAAAASDSGLDERVGFTDVSFDEADTLSGDDEFAASIDSKN